MLDLSEALVFSVKKEAEGLQMFLKNSLLLKFQFLYQNC